MAKNTRNEYGADVTLVACCHVPENVTSVEGILVFIDEDHMLEFRERTFPMFEKARWTPDLKATNLA